MLIGLFVFVLGAVVGSFLNVCIHRLPRGLRIDQPRRSFCPRCEYRIPWYCNIPLLSWLALRGRCANCGAGISLRYFVVELLTALAFLALWLVFPADEAAAYWVLACLLVVATFIDFEHFIIPDSITWGGVAAGLACSALAPGLMNAESHLVSALWSLAGAAAGYFTLWGVVEGGKLLFGRKRIAFEKSEPFQWVRDGDDATLTLGGECLQWSELFARASDELIIETSGAATADGAACRNRPLRFRYDRLASEEPAIALDRTDSIKGVASAIVIPREAMGFGDVKFIAAIGAFLGWQAVFFTIFAASVVGALVGVASILGGHREWSAKIPFGPYLALGAMVWLFAGPQLLEWYLQLLAPPV